LLFARQGSSDPGFSRRDEAGNGDLAIPFERT
jgi:hypothetical protein